MHVQRGKRNVVAHDEVARSASAVVDVAVVEAAVVDRLDAAAGSSDGLERLVVDGDRARARPPRRSGRARRRRRAARRRSASTSMRGRVVRASATSIPAGNGRDSASTSSPVRTPITPRGPSAAVAIERVMRAWASCERRIAACHACGDGSRSSMNRPSPRSSASSSKRGKRAADPGAHARSACSRRQAYFRSPAQST